MGAGGSEEVEREKKTTNYREQVKSRHSDPQILKVPSHKVSIRTAGKEEHVPGDCTQTTASLWKPHRLTRRR